VSSNESATSRQTPVDHGRESVLVLGLGNPGSRYAGTRHNVGFLVLEELARRRGQALRDELCGSLVSGQDGVWLAVPQTYMNRSGFAARCLVERHGFPPHQILVVVDDVHLELGRLRLRRRGSAGGHRGLESILENLGTDEIARLRLGIGPAIPGEDLVGHVLGPFQEDELATVQEMVKRGADACEVWAREGIESAMNQFNA